MLPAVQPNGACHLTPKPPPQDPPAPPLPCVVALAAGSPRHSELWSHQNIKKGNMKLSYEIVLDVLL